MLDDDDIFNVLEEFKCQLKNSMSTENNFQKSGYNKDFFFQTQNLRVFVATLKID